MFGRSVWQGSRELLLAGSAAWCVEAVKPFGVSHELVVVTALLVFATTTAINTLTGTRHDERDSDDTEG